MSSERLGVAYEPQHGAAYVASWVKALKDDPQEIYKAAAEAGRISDYVCAAPERARAAEIEKAKDVPLATGKTKEERSIDAADRGAGTPTGNARCCQNARDRVEPLTELTERSVAHD